MLLWIIIGAFAPAAMFVVAPLTLFLFKSRGLYKEVFFSFLFVFILSDSRQSQLYWAQDIKYLLVIILAVFYFFDKKKFPFSSRIIYLFIPFIIVSCISIFYSESIDTCVQKTASYFLIIIIATNYVEKLLHDDAEDFLRSFMFFMGSILLAGFIFYLLGSGVATFIGRYRGILGNPNGLGVFTLIVFLVFNAIMDSFPELFSRTEKRVFYFLIIMSMIMSGSRASILGVLLFFITKSLYKRSAFLGFIVLLLLAFAYQYIMLNFETIVKFLNLDTYFRLETLEDGSGRLVAWKYAWENVQKNFFIGKGFDYTEYLFFKNREFLSKLGHQGNAHNTYLTFWLETGLIGVVFFFIAFIGNFIKASKKSFLAFPIMYTILFSATFESWLTGSLNPETILVWIVLVVLFNKKNVGSYSEEIGIQEAAAVKKLNQ